MRFDSEPSDSVVPVKRTAKFMFDVSKSDEYYQDLLGKFNKLNQRIENLMDAATIERHPFARYIFQTVGNPDPAELTRLANALNLIAELYSILQQLGKQVSFIEFARSNPDVAEIAFADSTPMIDSLQTWLSEQ